MAEPSKRKGGVRKRTVQREDDDSEPETLSIRYLASGKIAFPASLAPQSANDGLVAAT